jgi:hypothetical protein
LIWLSRRTKTGDHEKKRTTQGGPKSSKERGGGSVFIDRIRRVRLGNAASDMDDKPCTTDLGNYVEG